MYRRKTILSAGPILVLIGAAAPAAATAVAGAELRAQSQTAAQAARPATGDERDRTDLLSQPVTLDLVDAPLESALEAIARRAGLALAYNPDILPAGRTVTLRASALHARDALARVLHGTGLEPSITRSGQLTLARGPDAPADAADAAAGVPQQGVVTGVVTDAGTGDALRGAQVRVDESELSAGTDAEGRYTLEDVPPGTHTLVASMIGYGEAHQAATVAAGTTASVDFALTVSAVPLDEMVVTGTMVPTQLRAVPSPVSIITAEDIERKGVVRFEDVLRSIPGVAVVGRNGQEYLTYVYVRGASSLNTQANTIKTYIDGVEIANVRYSLNQIDPASIERIELIRGPQASTLHGSEAIAGVLQIFTKKGRMGADRPQIQATLAGGNLESQYKDGFTLVQNHSVTIIGGDQEVSYRFGASYNHTGEWVENELLEQLRWNVRNSATDDLGFSGGVQYVIGPLTAEISARAHRKLRGAPIDDALSDPARSGAWNYPYLTKPSGTEHDLNFQTYGLSLAYRASQRWRHRLTIGQDGTVMEIRQPQPRITTPADTFLLYQYLDWGRRSFNYNTAFDLSIGSSLTSTLQAGLDISTSLQRITLTRDAKQLEGGLGNDHADITRGTLTNHGFFVQTQTAWNDQSFVTVGLRADRSTSFGGDFGYAWSPRVGIANVFEIGSLTAKFRASYGRAIRPPEPQYRLGQTLGNAVYLENGGLKPEAQSGYDVGLELHAGQRFSIGVTRYAQRAKDLIALVRMSEPSAMPQIRQYQNVGRIRNTGWEFEATGNLGRLSVSGNYGLMDSRVEELLSTYTGTAFVVGQRPLNTPHSTAAFSATYSAPPVTVTAGATYKGSWQTYRYLRYFEAVFGTDPNREPYTGKLQDYVDDYSPVRRYEVNATLEVTPSLTALVMIDNLLNDKTPDQYDYHLVRGRQIVVGLRFDSGV